MRDKSLPVDTDVDMSKGPLAHELGLAESTPVVPGKIIDHIFVPARGFMKGRSVDTGQVIRIIDLEGKQSCDCIFWDVNDFSNVSQYGLTALVNRRWDRWQVSDAIYSRNFDKMVTITVDTTDGRHPAKGFLCNEAYYRAKYGVHGHNNCRDNLLAAMVKWDFEPVDIDWGSNISFFLPIICHPDGRVTVQEVTNQPGDYIDLMAEMDIIVALSNCPDDLSPVNGYDPTPLKVVIFEPDKDYQDKVRSMKEARIAKFSG